MAALRRPYDPRCNRLLRCHVNHIFEQFKALPAQEYFEDDLYTRTTRTLDSGLALMTEIRERSYDHLITRVPFHIGGLVERGRARNVVSRMRRIVCAIGLDPARATIEGLKLCNVWLRCVVCESWDPSDAVHARPWSSAVSEPSATINFKANLSRRCSLPRSTNTTGTTPPAYAVQQARAGSPSGGAQTTWT